MNTVHATKKMSISKNYNFEIHNDLYVNTTNYEEALLY